MKRTLLLVMAAALVAAIALAAPAISVRPYQPRAVEFEVAAPSAGVSAAGSGAVTSAPLRAPRRFTMLGLRWRGTAEPDVHVRVRRDGGRWTRWTQLVSHAEEGPDAGSREARAGTGATAPAWAGQADWVQYRLSRRVAGLRIEFVNTTGTATAADRARTALRRAVNRGVVAAARLLDPNAGAAPARPPIVPRDQWGGAQCTPRSGPSYGEVKGVFVHHTVTMNEYTREEAPGMVLGVCKYHRNSNGWDDIGYNFLVDKYGTIYEGRAGGVDRPVIGAQAQGFNAQSSGISNLGTHTSVPQTNEALDAMARLIRWKLPTHGQPTSGTTTMTSAGGGSNRFPAGQQVTLQRISGHRDGNNTACPGDALYAQLPALRDRVGNVQPDPAPGGTAGTRIELSATPSVLSVPGTTRVAGRLLDGGGAGIGNAPVDVERFERGAWRPLAQATTDEAGDFATDLAPAINYVVRARFAGNETHAPSESQQTVVRVRPALPLTTSKTRAGVGRPVRLKGRVDPVKPTVGIVLARRVSAGRYKRVGVATLRPRASGRFGYTLKLRTKGLYRVYSRFLGDDLNLRARSASVFIRIGRGSVPSSPSPPGGPDYGDPSRQR